MEYKLFANLGWIYGWAAARETAMTKSELIRRIAELSPHLQQSDVERVIEAVFKKLGTALARRDRIEIRGFGAPSSSSTAARGSARTPASAP